MVSLYITLLLIIWICYSAWKPKNYPPGPKWIPIFGCFKEVSKLSRAMGGQHLALSHLSKKYNSNVIGLKLGGESVIAGFSYSTVKSILANEAFDGRPDNFFMRLRTMGTRKGITCTDGPFWTVQRQFVVKHLHDLGFGKKSMERIINEELQNALDDIDSQNGQVEINKLLGPSVINVLWALTAGFRFPRGDPKLRAFLAMMGKRSKLFDMSGGILCHFPWLRFVAPERTGYKLIQDLNANLKEFFLGIIRKHEEEWAENRTDDLIHHYLTEMKANMDKTFTYEQLVMICLDIFIAGSHTSSTTLDFTFLAMILHPDVQDKVHQSLDSAFNKDQHLEYADRQKVPYIEAVITEVLRFYTILPITGPRRVLKDTTLEGYFIPKETTVLISQHSVYTDSEHWGDPEVFRPERFLNEEGKFTPSDRVLAFGHGRRRCPGEILARSFLFLFFAGIMRKYKVSMPPGTEKPTGIPLPGIILSPEKYTAQFTPRVLT